MGMFDYIKVDREFPLPLPSDLGELTIDRIYGQEFQTKDLDNCLYNYDLTADGKLHQRLSKWVDRDRDPSDPLDFGGEIEETGETKLVSCPYTVNFYSIVQDDKLKNDYWMEWKLNVSCDGTYEISLFEWKVEPNAERVARSNEFWNNINRRNALLAKWYMRPYCWYSKLVHRTFRLYSKLKAKLPSSFKVEQFLTPL